MGEKKTSDLNQVLAVISGYETCIDQKTGKLHKSKIKPTVGIISDCKGYPDMLGIKYPMVIGTDWQGCGGMCYHNVKGLVNIRPATDEEIKAWRNARGLLASVRKRASTADKVKQMQWVKLSLERGETLITEM